MTSIAWSGERFGLGVPSMDSIHQELVAQLNTLARASEAEFPALLAELREHTRAHFAHEDALMIKYRFPAIIEHQAEHGRVLTELEDLSQRAAEGRIALGRAYVRDQLPDWFVRHAATMDSALAAHITDMERDRREGASPTGVAYSAP